MKISHITIWTKDIERLRSFYCEYFGAVSGEKYHNPTKDFTSYFLSFDDAPRLELMRRPRLAENASERFGLAHIAISVGSKESVDELTGTLKEAGYAILGNPRTTGDGYYESSIADPEGNIIEITV